MVHARNVNPQSLYHFNCFLDVFPLNIHTVLTTVRSAEIYGTHYQEKMVLVVRVNDILPTFGKIIHIIILCDSVLFVFNILKPALNYRRHICAYEVQESKEWLCLYHKNLIYHTPLWERTSVSDGKQVVSLKHLL